MDLFDAEPTEDRANRERERKRLRDCAESVARSPEWQALNDEPGRALRALVIEVLDMRMTGLPPAVGVGLREYASSLPERFDLATGGVLSKAKAAPQEQERERWLLDLEPGEPVDE